MGEQELLFPTKGLDLSLEFDRQPEDTTVYARNVRTQDPIEFRDRGGSRPGLSKYVATAPGSSPPPPPLYYTILTVTDDAGVAVVTVAAEPPNFDGSLDIVISGTSGGLYDGTWTPISTGLTTFDLNTAYVGDAAGGTWAFAP